MSDKPRQHTQKEMQDFFLHHLWQVVRYWEKVEDSPLPHNNFTITPKTVAERLEGMAFSFLAMLDGSCMDLPSFEVYPSPHPEDKEFHREEGENWWACEEDEISIHGQDALHELWHDFGRRHGYVKDNEPLRDPKPVSEGRTRVAAAVAALYANALCQSCAAKVAVRKTLKAGDKDS